MINFMILRLNVSYGAMKFNGFGKGTIQNEAHDSIYM